MPERAVPAAAIAPIQPPPPSRTVRACRSVLDNPGCAISEDAATFARLEGHGSLIRDLAFSHDGRFLISAGDSSVKFWGLSS